MEKAFSNTVTPIIELNHFQPVYLMGLLARYKIEQNEYISAEHYLNRIMQVKNKFPTIAQEIQLATLLTGYPLSIDNAKNTILNLENRLDKILDMKNINISYINDSDPYIFCILSIFNLEIYYEANIKSLMSKYNKLAVKVFPDLIYTAPHLKLDNKIEKKNEYKIGIVSSFFSDNTSVLLDFKGVINKLPDKYNLTFIYLNESNKDSSYLKTKDNVLEYHISNNWLETVRKDISKLNLDILFYLEPVMSSMVQRLMKSKLAKIQLVSHGHPTTSGHDSNLINYYISWAGAELDYDKANKHYTEELILIPKNTIHQYYTPVSHNNMSLKDNYSFKDITREDFIDYAPPTCNWYLCMQKPFKRHPQFDNIVKNILDKDPNGRVLLHGEEKHNINKIINDRLNNINTDMSRVHLIPLQPHFRLMALYKLSDVILDSYYAGGCTTSREALELGAPIVTLPSRYLGSRWTYGYYNIMDVHDLIAINKEDYVKIAIKLGTNKKYNNEIKNKIKQNVNKLFYQQSAVNAWDNIFQEIIDKELNKNN
jgi:predicted O-linked N-acetylglucosamine transferase (SPINDLY family)